MDIKSDNGWLHINDAKPGNEESVIVVLERESCPGCAYDFKVCESIFKYIEFYENMRPLVSPTGWRRRERYGFHTIDKPGCIVSNAHKPERSRKIALNSGIQSVDVFGAIVASPFKTEDIYRLLIH
jgi:hypothetical protein